MHTGHLEIEGRKMSKSLKNFITIGEVLRKYTGRQIRIMVLMHRWNSTFGYSDGAIPEAVELERQLYEFFLNVQVKTRKVQVEGEKKWSAEDKVLYESLNKVKESIHNALCDSFDTPAAMRFLLELISTTNTYITKASNVKAEVIEKVADYVRFVLLSFGVISNSSLLFTNFTDQNNTEKVIAPYLDALCKFRDDVKANAKEGVGKIFDISSRLRDEVLPELGVRVEDAKLGEPSQWKFEDKEKLKADMKKRMEAKEEKMKLKQECEERGKCPPEEYFKGMKEKYSQFDEKGIPTHDAAGKKLKSDVIKRLRKEYRVQRNLHTMWLAKKK